MVHLALKIPPTSDNSEKIMHITYDDNVQPE